MRGAMGLAAQVQPAPGGQGVATVRPSDPFGLDSHGRDIRMPTTLTAFAAATAMGLLIAGPAAASSDEAWAEFAAEVEASCLAATAETLPGASATVDPFGSESFGLAIVSGRTPEDAPASVICVMDKRSRAVEIGGALEITVARPGLAPLTAAELEGAGLSGELSCGFEAGGGTLLLAAGDVASEAPSEAIVRLPGGLARLGAPGGFDAMLEGAEFTGPEGAARVEVTGASPEGGESPAHPATLTLQPENGAPITAEGLWRCGP